jgi:hypothetical protein
MQNTKYKIIHFVSLSNENFRGYAKELHCATLLAAYETCIGRVLTNCVRNVRSRVTETGCAGEI